VKLLETDNTKGIQAPLEIDKAGRSGAKPVKIWMRHSDDLYWLSNEH